MDFPDPIRCLACRDPSTPEPWTPCLRCRITTARVAAQRLSLRLNGWIEEARSGSFHHPTEEGTIRLVLVFRDVREGETVQVPGPGGAIIGRAMVSGARSDVIPVYITSESVL